MNLTSVDTLRTGVFKIDNWTEKLHKALQSVAWEIFSIVRTMSGYNLGQLVFSRDKIIQTVVIADWEKIEQLKRNINCKK